MNRCGVVMLVVVGCSSSAAPVTDGPPGDSTVLDAGAVDMAPGPFALTSPALTPGGAIAVANSCQGANESPALDWTGAPAGAASFAVVLTDTSNNLVHSVIYDIAMTSTGLPTGVAKTYEPGNVAGAHQTLAYDNQTRGYLGPCPGSVHTYEFAVYGIGTTALPTATMTTTRAQAMTLIAQHQIAKATLVGTFTP